MARKLPKVPPPLKTNRLEVRYGADITTMLAPFKELVERELFPMLDYITQAQPVKLDAAGMPPACSKHAPGMPPAWREDAAGDDIRKIFEKIKLQYERSFSPKIISRIAQETAGKVESQNHKSFRKQTKTVLGVDPVFAEPWLAEETESFVHENASLIKSIPQEHLADIEQMVFRESRRGSSPAEIKAKVAELFKTTDNAAALIARDQVAKFNGRLSQLRQTSAGITHYIWRTAEDGRVRTLANSSGYSSHAALDGKTFSWDDPPATVFKGKRAGERNHPGQDIQCRCYAEPVFAKVEKKVAEAPPVEPKAPSLKAKTLEEVLSGPDKLPSQVIMDLISNRKSQDIGRVNFPGAPKKVTESILSGLNESVVKYGGELRTTGWQIRKRKSLGIANKGGAYIQFQQTAAKKLNKEMPATKEYYHKRLAEKIELSEVALTKPERYKGEHGRAQARLDMLRKTKRWGAYMDAPNPLAAVASHEGFHNVYYTHNLEEKFSEALKARGLGDSVEWYAVSEYGATSKSELFAEIGASLSSGVEIPEGFVSAFNEVTEAHRRWE